MAYHLKTRIAITVSMLTLGFMSLISWLALSHFEEGFKSATFSHFADSLSITANGISSRIEHALHTLETIRNEMPAGILDDPERMQAFLDQQDTSLLTFDNGIALFSPDGPLLAVNPRQEDIIGMDFSFRDYIKITLQTRQPYISAPFISRQQHHHPIIMLTEPVFDVEGNVVAILGGSFDLYGNNFLQALINAKVGKEGHYMMVDQHDKMLIHPNRENILSPVEEFFPRAQVVKFLETSHGRVNRMTMGDQEMIGTFQHVSPLNWVLVALSPLKESYQPIQQARIYLIFALVFLSAATILIVRYLSNRLTAPLVELTEKVRLQVRQQDKPLGPVTGSYEELGDLATSIQLLLTDVAAKRKGLSDQLAFLQNLVDTIPGPIFYKDTDFRYIGCNSAFIDYIGIPRDELVGKSVFDIAPPDLAKHDHQADSDLLKQGGEQMYETSLKYANGTVHDVIYYKKIFTDTNGTPAGMIGTFLDITERKQSEIALKQALQETQTAKQQVENILSSAADGLIVTDNRNRVTHINHIAEGMLNVVSEEVVGHAFNDLFVDHQLREQAKAFLDGTGQNSNQFDFRLNLAEAQSPHIIQARSSMLRTEKGDSTGVVVLLRDVSRERELDQIKSEFISTAAHEMRTPMSVIMGYIEVLMDSDRFGNFPPEKQREFLRQAYRKAAALSQIVDDLFDLSRIESGLPLPIVRTECDLEKIVREVVDRYQSSSIKSQFEVTLDGNIDLYVDCNKMTQVFENLISNAIKYSPDGGMIGVKSTLRGDRLRIDIADRGTGMTPEQVERVFDKFYRANNSSTTVSGLGLGMSIVKAIVEGHGGHIWVESKIGEGTCVSIELPLDEDRSK